MLRHTPLFGPIDRASTRDMLRREGAARKPLNRFGAQLCYAVAIYSRAREKLGSLFESIADSTGEFRFRQRHKASRDIVYIPSPPPPRSAAVE